MSFEPPKGPSRVDSYHWLRCHIDHPVAVISIDNPRVNALSTAVRGELIALVAELESVESVEWIVVTGIGQIFAAGADIKEFDLPPQRPTFPDLIERFERSSKKVVAAINGPALGGAFEFVLGCQLRLAAPTAVIGLPEVTLGLIPGAGGTQRVPRLTDPQTAIRIVCRGERLAARDALQSGLVDAVIEEQPFIEAVKAKLTARESEPLPIRQLRSLPSLGAADEAIAAERARLTARGTWSVPQRAALDCLERAYTEPFDRALAKERKAFLSLRDSDESRALRYAFVAERIAGRRFGPRTRNSTVGKVAIVGAGTMGTGIAIAFLSVGYDVVLVDSNGLALDRARRSVSSTAASRGQDWPNSFLGAEDLKATNDCQLYVEAVFEDREIKRTVLRDIEAIASKDALIATNTSYIDIDQLAGELKHPERFAGLHFFIPAEVMRLVEVVRGTATSTSTCNALSVIARGLDKMPVLVGSGYGFVGNRMLSAFRREALFLLEEGATPQQVDKALTDFGFRMGPFAVYDLAGLDIAWRDRQARKATRDPAVRDSTLLDKLHQLGRLGRKTGAGWYSYEDGRTPLPDPAIEALLEEHSREIRRTRRTIGDEEIQNRCLIALINAGAEVLWTGVAQGAADIDVIWLLGYGFPRHRGGPMYCADRLGLDRVLARLRDFASEHGEALWTPSPLVRALAEQGRPFAEFDPARDSGATLSVPRTRHAPNDLTP